ncbi:MAG TPA: hypothetical protein VN370_00640 [Desulfitobacteriaceae bacterium]|nr:hypothetical protein [Desulfitobacteriaceae bacterium]
MSKLNILKKVLAIIEGSLAVPDGTTNGTTNGTTDGTTNGTTDGTLGGTVDQDCSQADSGAVNLTDKTRDEQAVKGLAKEFVQALNDRDFECLDSRAEYHLYTVGHFIELIKNNDEQNTIKLLTEYKIKSTYEDCEFLSITFNEDREQAEVVCNVRTCVLSADGKYFKQLNKKNKKKNRISKGIPFSTAYTLLAIKEKGTWKIGRFEVSEENIKISR